MKWKQLLTLYSAIAISTSLAWAQSSRPVKVIYPTKVDTSPPLIELAKKAKPPQTRREFYEVPNTEPPITPPGNFPVPDPVWQSEHAKGAAVPTIQNFEGMNNDDNQATVGFRVSPPDPNFDVGPNYVVQMRPATGNGTRC